MHLALPENIFIYVIEVLNTLAYNDAELITAVKKFYKRDPWMWQQSSFKMFKRKFPLILNLGSSDKFKDNLSHTSLLYLQLWGERDSQKDYRATHVVEK